MEEVEWVVATRKRLRDEADAVWKKEEAEKAARVALEETQKLTDRERRRKGLDDVKVALAFIQSAVQDCLPLIELDEICLVDIRSNKAVIGLARFVPTRRKESFLANAKDLVLRNPVCYTWKDDGEDFDNEEDDECIFPDNFLDICVHVLYAWGYQAGLECSARQSEGGNMSPPFDHARLTDDDYAKDKSYRCRMIGFRVAYASE
jgi:hypothetical protein